MAGWPSISSPYEFFIKLALPACRDLGGPPARPRGLGPGSAPRRRAASRLSPSRPLVLAAVCMSTQLLFCMEANYHLHQQQVRTCPRGARACRAHPSNGRGALVRAHVCGIPVPSWAAASSPGPALCHGSLSDCVQRAPRGHCHHHHVHKRLASSRPLQRTRQQEQGGARHMGAQIARLRTMLITRARDDAPTPGGGGWGAPPVAGLPEGKGRSEPVGRGPVCYSSSVSFGMSFHSFRTLAFSGTHGASTKAHPLGPADARCPAGGYVRGPM